MFYKFRMERRASKRERELVKQMWLMRKTYGWRSTQAVLAKARVKEFRRMRKIVFQLGMTGIFNYWGDAFSTYYPRRPMEWERWGRWFREDWT